MENNVVDIRTKKALFDDGVRGRLQSGLIPYLREDATDATRAQVVNVVEQVLCVAVISAVRSFAERLALKIVDKLVGKVEPVKDTKPTDPAAPV